MTAENGNGELKQLLEIKRSYRKELAEREAELKAECERKVAAAKKELKGKYLEKVVDSVFAEPATAPEAKLEPPPSNMTVQYSSSQTPSAEGTRVIAGYEPEKVPAAVKSPRCPECNAPVDPTDKFCAECAYPLEDVKENAPVVSSARKFRSRRR
jgi:hypothetical protein